jgi:GST-like protein
MIDLYSWPTPNGVKLHIMLEETGVEYTVHPIDIGKGEQFEPEFLKISPNNKIPAMVDRNGPDGQPYPMFESGAMLMYLAEKAGKFMPEEMAARYHVVQWLMFQMGHVGPMFGQFNHFAVYAPEKLPYAIERYTKEVARLYGVIDRRLAEADYLAGDYSIADIAVWPWTRGYDRHGIDLADYPSFKRWFDAIDARPGVQRGVEVLSEFRRSGPPDKETLNNYFGNAQYARR